MESPSSTDGCLGSGLGGALGGGALLGACSGVFALSDRTGLLVGVEGRLAIEGVADLEVGVADLEVGVDDLEAGVGRIEELGVVSLLRERGFGCGAGLPLSS